MFGSSGGTFSLLNRDSLGFEVILCFTDPDLGSRFLIEEIEILPDERCREFPALDFILVFTTR